MATSTLQLDVPSNLHREWGLAVNRVNSKQQSLYLHRTCYFRAVNLHCRNFFASSIFVVGWTYENILTPNFSQFTVHVYQTMVMLFLLACTQFIYLGLCLRSKYPPEQNGYTKWNFATFPKCQIFQIYGNITVILPEWKWLGNKYTCNNITQVLIVIIANLSKSSLTWERGTRWSS